MTTKVITKEAIVSDNRIIVTEETETSFDKTQLENELRHVRSQKEALEYQNAELLKRHNELTEEENELLAYIELLPVKGGIIPIGQRI